MNILTFLLALLKILGIVLLYIILTFIVILTVALLVRIRYNIEAEKSDKLYADIEVTWFLKIVYFRYRISDKGKKVILKILGKSFYKDKKAFEIVTDSTTPLPKVKNDDSSPNDSIEEIKSQPQTQKQKMKKVNQEVKELVSEEKEKLEDEIEKDIKEYSIIDRIKYVWNHYDIKKIKHLSIKLAKKLFKAVLPKELLVDIEFGSSDPAKTGYVLAMSSILVLYFGNNVKVKGNFDESVLNGKLKAKGSFAIGQIAYALIIFAISKPIRKIIWKYLKNRKKDN